MVVGNQAKTENLGQDTTTANNYGRRGGGGGACHASSSACFRDQKMIGD